MATRGTIALEFADKIVGMVYSHWDNYPEHNGKILQEHYLDPFKVRELIDGGNISSLSAEIGVQHPFNNPHDWGTVEYRTHEAVTRSMTTFYGRDRGELGQQAVYYKDFADYEYNGVRQEYNYILRNVAGKPTWYVNGELLEDALKNVSSDV